MLMTSDELKDIFRREVDDLAPEDDSTSDEGCLWSDDDVYRYMNSAASMVARRTYSLYKILTFPVVADEAMIRLPRERVLKARRAYLQTSARELEQLNLGDTVTISDYGLQLRSSAWETTTGTPVAYILDYEPGYLRLYPIPSASDTLVLHANTMPPQIFESSPLPFTDDEDISLVLLWMKKLAYDKHDADTFDPGKSARFEQEFDRRVLEREPEIRRRTRVPGVIRSNW